MLLFNSPRSAKLTLSQQVFIFKRFYPINAQNMVKVMNFFPLSRKSTALFFGANNKFRANLIKEHTLYIGKTGVIGNSPSMVEYFEWFNRQPHKNDILTTFAVNDALINVRRPLRFYNSNEEGYTMKTLSIFITKKMVNKFDSYIEKGSHTSKIGHWTASKDFLESTNIEQQVLFMTKKIIFHLMLSNASAAKAFTELFFTSKHLRLEWYYPMLQDALRQLFLDITFKMELLHQLVEYKINYASYRFSPREMQALIEAVVGIKTLSFFVQRNSFIQAKIIVQTPEDIVSIPQKYRDAGKSVAKQECTDFRLETNLIKAIVNDIKLKSNPMEKLNMFEGSISFCVEVKLNVLLNKYKASLGCLTTDKKLKTKFNTAQMKEIEGYKKEIVKLEQELALVGNKQNIEQKLHKLLDAIDLNENLPTLVSTRIVQLPVDVFFEDFIAEISSQNTNHQLILNEIKDMIDNATKNQTERPIVIPWKDILILIVTKLPPSAKQKLITSIDGPDYA